MYNSERENAIEYMRNLQDYEFCDFLKEVLSDYKNMYYFDSNDNSVKDYQSFPFIIREILANIR